MVFREAIAAVLQKGVPTVTALTAGFVGYRRHSGKLLPVAGYALGGFLGGWLAQWLLYNALEQSSSDALPEKTGDMKALGALPAHNEHSPLKKAPDPVPGEPRVENRTVKNNEGLPIAGNGTVVEYH